MLGVYAIISLIPSYAESVGRFKFDVAAVYFLGKKKYLIGEVLLTLNFLALATSGLIVSLIVWQFDWIYGLLFSNTKYDATALIYFILVQIPLHFLWMNYSYLVLHKEDVVTYNRMVIIIGLVSSLLSITLLLMFDLGLWAVAGSTVLATLLSLIYGVVGMGAVGPHGKILNRPLIRDLFQYGSKLYLGGLIGHFQAYLTNLLTALYLAPAQVSFFSMARGFGQMIDQVPTALNSVLFPLLSKTVNPDEAALIAARAFRLLLVLLIVVGLVAAILIYPAVYLMYGSAFLPIVIPFLILIPGIVSLGVAAPFMQYFMSIDRSDLAVILPILPLVVQFVIALLLIPIWGPTGAALALTTGNVVLSLISFRMFLKLSSCNIRSDLMVSREDLVFLFHFSKVEAEKIWKTINPIRP